MHMPTKRGHGTQLSATENELERRTGFEEGAQEKHRPGRDCARPGLLDLIATLWAASSTLS